MYLGIVLVVRSCVVESRVERDSDESRSRYRLTIDPCSFVGVRPFPIPVTVEEYTGTGNDRPSIEELVHDIVLSRRFVLPIYIRQSWRKKLETDRQLCNIFKCNFISTVRNIFWIGYLKRE